MLSAELVAELGEQLEHRALNRDVERRGDLVADQQVGTRRERARDRDALALAAGQLGGIAGAGARRQPHQSSRRSRLGQRVGLPEVAELASRAPDDLAPTVWRGLSESYGFWKTICISPARLARAAAGARRERRAVEPDRAAFRLVQARRRSGRSSSCRCRIRPPARRTRPRRSTNEMSSRGDHRLAAAPVRRRQPGDLEQPAARAGADDLGAERLDAPAAVSAATRSSATRWPAATATSAGSSASQRAPAARSAARTRSPADARPRRRPRPESRAAGAARAGRAPPRRGRACRDAAARESPRGPAPPRRSARRTSRRSGRRSTPTTARSCET